MTFSIVGRSADGRLGVAVASKFLGIGGPVPAAEAGVGAVATQAYINLAFRPRGLAMLGTGVSAAGTVAGLIAADGEGAVDRQVGVVGAEGPGATFTGSSCTDWAGGVTGDGYAIQGNMLTGADVVGEMEKTWLAGAPQRRLAYRLLASLRAGDDAGGDKRGRQSAALLVVAKGEGYGGTSDVAVDLRVDDHPAPVRELARLLRLQTLIFTSPEPADLIELAGPVADEVRGLLAAAGQPCGESVTELDKALETWATRAGVANLEDWIVAGSIDPLVLDQLRS
jgi:uncharacterized Ntn-hydrolase superfamily protein